MRIVVAAVLLAVATALRAAVPAGQMTEAVEFRHAAFDHYFVTSIPKEISDLDTGVHTGWARTGQKFWVIVPGGDVAGSASVCRFYGLPEAGLDSHFFSASVQECGEVKQKFATSWKFEADEVFKAFLPDTQTGSCPAGTKSVYRLWNNRRDSNHRYTVDLGIFNQMKSQGYVAEGYGNPALPVALCSPVPETAPVCTMSASSTSPVINTPLTLTATCTNAPTQYAWTGCTGTGSTCTVTETAAGPKTYGVTASNASGAGIPASVQVTWLAVPPPPPTCSLSASATSLPTGSMLTLTASCTNNPTSYNWMSCHPLLVNLCNVIPTCSAASNTCTLTSLYTGTERYAVEGVNAGVPGARVGIAVDWTTGNQPPPPPPPTPTAPSCTISAPTVTPQINSTIVLSAQCSGNPTSFQWTGPCTPSGATCSATSSQTGPLVYTVAATNSIGQGSPAQLTLNWQPIMPPSCTLAASSTSPYVNSNITLTATCPIGNPTSFAWSANTNCQNTTSTCTTTSTAAGAQTYSVVATGAGGPGAPAQRTVTWVALPTAPPSCTVTADNTAPTVGMTITLTAACTNSPTSYQWTSGCNGTSATCTHAATAAGAVTYTVVASNPPGAGGGPGAPASTTVTWGAAPPTTDFCGSRPVITTNAVVAGGSYFSSNAGAFGDSETWVIRVSAPNGGTINASVVEYQGPPTYRDMTISRSRCDFRTPDPTGTNGPYRFSNGKSPGALQVVPAGTYYVNVRNRNPDGTASCGQSSCNALLTLR